MTSGAQEQFALTTADLYNQISPERHPTLTKLNGIFPDLLRSLLTEHKQDIPAKIFHGLKQPMTAEPATEIDEIEKKFTLEILKIEAYILQIADLRGSSCSYDKPNGNGLFYEISRLAALHDVFDGNPPLAINSAGLFRAPIRTLTEPGKERFIHLSPEHAALFSKTLSNEQRLRALEIAARFSPQGLCLSWLSLNNSAEQLKKRNYFPENIQIFMQKLCQREIRKDPIVFSNLQNANVFALWPEVFNEFPEIIAVFPFDKVRSLRPCVLEQMIASMNEQALDLYFKKYPEQYLIPSSAVKLLPPEPSS